MDLMDLVGDRIKILAEGPWSEDDVNYDVRASCAPYISPALKELAAQRYAARQEELIRRGYPVLEDHDVMHLCSEHSCITKSGVYLVMGTIKYSQYCVAKPEVAREFGLRMEDLPVGMGVNVVIRTADNQFVTIQSSDMVDFPEKINVVGGCYNGGHPFDMIRQEIHEEVGIDPQELTNLVLLGLSFRMEDRFGHQLHFFADTSLPAPEVLKRSKTAPDSWEGQIILEDCDAGLIHEDLRYYGESGDTKLVASCYTVLVMAGRYMWGREWSRVNNTAKGGRDDN